MGKSGYLPDISYNFGFYRTLAVNSLQRKDYGGARSSLFNLNGCLGEEYLVSINSEWHEQACKDQSVYLCNHCTMSVEKIVNKGEENEYTKEIQIPTEISKSNVKVFDLTLPFFESVLLKSKSEKAWLCPVCKKVNKMKSTKKVISEKERPYFLKVIPECPIRPMGIDRLFVTKFEGWFWNFLEEINWQEVFYRKEYISQHGQDMDISGYTENEDKA